MSETESRAPRNLIFVMAILLTTAAALGIVFAPIAKCPACNGKGIITLVLNNNRGQLRGTLAASCPHCHAGRVGLLKLRQIPLIEKALVSTED
jgi:hypothetical protein